MGEKDTKNTATPTTGTHVPATDVATPTNGPATTAAVPAPKPGDPVVPVGATGTSAHAPTPTPESEKAREEQIAADQRKLAEEQNKEPVVVAGDAKLGGAFSITGPGLGSGGTLTIAGRHIVPTRWDDRSIRGELPPGLRGPVVLTTDKGTRHGVFPTPKKVVTETTTTTVKTDVKQ